MRLQLFEIEVAEMNSSSIDRWRCGARCTESLRAPCGLLAGSSRALRGPLAGSLRAPRGPPAIPSRAPCGPPAGPSRAPRGLLAGTAAGRRTESGGAMQGQRRGDAGAAAGRCRHSGGAIQGQRRGRTVAREIVEGEMRGVGCDAGCGVWTWQVTTSMEDLAFYNQGYKALCLLITILASVVMNRLLREERRGEERRRLHGITRLHSIT